MKPLLSKILILVMSLFLMTAPSESFSQKKKKKDKGDAEAPKADDKVKTYDEIIKKSTKNEGLFTLYTDTVTGKTFFEIKEDQLNKEYIYFSYIADGVLDAGFFRGSYRGSKILTFQRFYETIEIHAPNTNYYFDEENALSKAKGANINTPILSSLKIEGEKDGMILISGDDIFLSEDFQMVKPPRNPKSPPGMLGNLSKEKTKINEVRNYPENTDVVVSYVYDNKNPSRYGSPAVTDARSIVVDYQHSLIAVPENDFQPRFDDPRVGYFMTQVNDMTSFSATPYRDVIHRWNLVKKNPDAAVSEPVEPITWWIENTTPEEFRGIIKEGVERWNTSFEKAGFKNAVVVNIQPDDADWDAGDIRYNVLRWTSSPIPPFGGYGPSFVNPRTGQILGADIMLEFAAVTRRLFNAEVFELAGFMQDAEFDKEAEMHDPYSCQASNHLHHNLLFGLHSMKVMNVEKAAEKEFIKQSLYRLSLHEVGHTLGLTHNMRASSIYSVEQLKDKAFVDINGLSNSVMEYPAVNYPLNESEKTLYYDVKPGYYDDWVIEYGYTSNENKLDAILSRSTEPYLVYGNDADDMRSSGKGINPEVNIYDLSNDPVRYASERCELVNKVMPKIISAYSIEDQSFQELRNAYLTLTGEHSNQIRIMTRQIGGVRYDRAFSGQETEHLPFEPIARERQKAAMAGLKKYAFAPDAFDEPTEVYKYLLGQRRGFNHFVNSDDPKIHDRVLNMQRDCLNHLLHPNVMRRISDSQMYGGDYDLAEMTTDLTNAIFKADLKSDVNTMRQNLQVEYTKRLTRIIGEKSKYDHVSKGVALDQLNKIKGMMKNSPSSDTMTRAHRKHLIWIIDQALEA